MCTNLESRHYDIQFGANDAAVGLMFLMHGPNDSKWLSVNAGRQCPFRSQKEVVQRIKIYYLEKGVVMAASLAKIHLLKVTVIVMCINPGLKFLKSTH